MNITCFILDTTIQSPVPSPLYSDRDQISNTQLLFARTHAKRRFKLNMEESIINMKMK